MSKPQGLLLDKSLYKFFAGIIFGIAHGQILRWRRKWRQDESDI